MCFVCLVSDAFDIVCVRLLFVLTSFRLFCFDAFDVLVCCCFGCCWLLVLVCCVLLLMYVLMLVRYLLVVEFVLFLCVRCVFVLHCLLCGCPWCCVVCLFGALDGLFCVVDVCLHLI